MTTQERKNGRIVVRKNVDVFEDTYNHFRRAVAWAQKNGESKLTLKMALEAALLERIAAIEKQYGDAPKGKVKLRSGPRIDV